ncbi:hypothetical protein RZS08_45745, partial [Arthrospira platensis SPKY1]|nr:hypothetical protein [Arthrospira platensis SPKY1]
IDTVSNTNILGDVQAGLNAIIRTSGGNLTISKPIQGGPLVRLEASELLSINANVSAIAANSDLFLNGGSVAITGNVGANRNVSIHAATGNITANGNLVAVNE